MSKIQEFLKNQEKSVMSIVEGKTIIDYLNNNAEESSDYPALNTPINNEYTGCLLYTSPSPRDRH